MSNISKTKCAVLPRFNLLTDGFASLLEKGGDARGVGDFAMWKPVMVATVVPDGDSYSGLTELCDRNPTISIVVISGQPEAMVGALQLVFAGSMNVQTELDAEAENRLTCLQTELAQARERAAEASGRVAQIETEADERVARAGAEADECKRGQWRRPKECSLASNAKRRRRGNGQSGPRLRRSGSGARRTSKSDLSSRTLQLP